MLKPLRKTSSKLLPMAMSMAIVLGASHPVYAQTADIEAPVLIPRQIDSGVAGELQTFLARVSDDFGVEQVLLHYRQGDSGGFRNIPMRPLLDSIGEYMIAVETQVAAYPGLQYYIEAVDAAGNITNRGFSYAPIVLPLTEAVPVVSNPTPGPVVQPRPQPQSQPQPAGEPVVAERDGGFSISPALVIVGVGALIALGALAAGGSDDGGDATANNGNIEPVPTTNPITNPETVTLTIISDQPSAN